MKRICSVGFSLRMFAGGFSPGPFWRVLTRLRVSALDLNRLRVGGLKPRQNGPGLKPPANIRRLKPTLQILCLFFTFSAWSLPPASMDLAQQYYDAGDYSQAKRTYEGLQDDRLPLWKKEVLDYNIATSLLAGGNYEEAALDFEILSDKNIPLPQLKQRVLSNLSLAKIGQLESRLSALKENAKARYEDFNKVYAFFRDVLVDIAKAETAACALEKFEGAETCPPSLYLQEMRLKVESSKTQFLKDYEAFRLAHPPLPAGQGSAREVLQQLLDTYGFTLAEDPLRKGALDQIQKIQTDVQSLLKKSGDDRFLEDYEKAQSYLKLSLQSFDETHPARTRLFAEVARFYVQQLLEQLDVTPKMQATALLENVIEKQEFVLLLDRLRDQVAEGEKGLDQIDQLVKEQQTSVLKAADQFPDVVVARQEEAFSAKGNAEARCQCQPWDEVIPLFSDGYAKAQQAAHYMNKESPESAVLPLQKSAIEKWKEALAKMREKAAPKKKSAQKQENQPQNQDQSQDQQQQDTKLNETLRLVQEMENDDRSTPQQVKTQPGSSKGEERPW